MKCPHCGKEIANYSRFCECCGGKIEKSLVLQTIKPYLILTACVVAVGCLLSVFLLMNKKTTSPKNIIEQGDPVIGIEVEPTIQWEEAKKIATDVMMKRPLMAVGYKDNNEKIVALFDSDGMTEGVALEVPQLELVVLEKEGGVWSKEIEHKLDMNKFTDLGGYFFIFNDSCSVLVHDGQYYFYYNCVFGPGGTLDTSECHDYVAINLSNGLIYQLAYFTDPRSYNTNGQLQKDEACPKDIEEYLLSKLEADKSAKKIDSADLNEIDMYKDWVIDNASCYEGDLKRGEQCRLTIHLYDKPPYSETSKEEKDGYKATKTGHYVIYGSWRGNIFAYDEKLKKYFPIWVVRGTYETYLVDVIDDHQIRLVNSELGDPGEETYAIEYNLDTKTCVEIDYVIDHQIEPYF